MIKIPLLLVEVLRPAIHQTRQDQVALRRGYDGVQAVVRTTCRCFQNTFIDQRITEHPDIRQQGSLTFEPSHEFARQRPRRPTCGNPNRQFGKCQRIGFRCVSFNQAAIENGIHQRRQKRGTRRDGTDVGQPVSGQRSVEFIRVVPRIVQWLVRPRQLKRVCLRATINHLAGSHTTDFVQWLHRRVDSMKISHPKQSLSAKFG